MATTYPEVLLFGVATANIQNLTDLSRPDTRTALESVRDQAGIIGFQETIEAGDNQDIDTVFPKDTYAHLGVAGENDLIVRRSRWSLASDSALAHAVGKGLPEKDGKVINRGHFKIGTSKAHVQPQRIGQYAIYTFDENPLLTPVVHLNTHLVSGVDSGLSPQAYRAAERKDQYAALQRFVMACTAAGLNVIFTADTNWKAMPGFTPATRRLINATIDKVWFVPADKANWTLALVDSKSAVERIQNPSDHDAFVANVQLTVNANYLPPVAKPVSAQVADWAHQYGVTGEALTALEAILSKAGIK